MSDSFVRPNFFIVGAPRSGTTAMSSYLAEHPDVLFSDPKEPLYFCSDLPGVRFVDNESDYLAKCFAHDETDVFKAIGEGSVWYLYSERAIPQILEFDPQAKFIFMIRNPLDMLLSLHQKLYLFLDEDEEDFSKAWQLQEQRSRGQKLAKTCREPKLLQYAEIGKLGAQLDRAFRIVPPAQRMTILFDDLQANTLSVYKSVLTFLELDYDGRLQFSIVNENQRVKSRMLLELAWNPPKWSVKFVNILKRPFGVERIRLLSTIRDRLSANAPKPELSTEFKNMLLEEFSDDIALLSDLTEIDLSTWREGGQGQTNLLAQI